MLFRNFNTKGRITEKEFKYFTIDFKKVTTPVSFPQDSQNFI